MDQIRNYLFSIVAAAILCSLFQQIIQNFQAKSLGKIICGFVLIITVLRPLTKLDNLELDDFSFSYEQSAQDAIIMGQELAYDARVDIIKNKTEAYILDKAAELNADISVSVFVQDSEVPVPISADISGNVSPYVRQQLKQIMEADLGITKENQKWIG